MKLESEYNSLVVAFAKHLARKDGASEFTFDDSHIAMYESSRLFYLNRARQHLNYISELLKDDLKKWGGAWPGKDVHTLGRLSNKIPDSEL